MNVSKTVNLFNGLIAEVNPTVANLFWRGGGHVGMKCDSAAVWVTVILFNRADIMSNKFPLKRATQPNQRPRVQNNVIFPLNPPLSH